LKEERVVYGMVFYQPD